MVGLHVLAVHGLLSSHGTSMWVQFAVPSTAAEHRSIVQELSSSQGGCPSQVPVSTEQALGKHGSTVPQFTGSYTHWSDAKSHRSTVQGLSSSQSASVRMQPPPA